MRLPQRLMGPGPLIEAQKPRLEGSQMDNSKRYRWRDAALDILVSQTAGLGEMSNILEALQEDWMRGGAHPRHFRDTGLPVRLRS